MQNTIEPKSTGEFRACNSLRQYWAVHSSPLIRLEDVSTGDLTVMQEETEL